MSQRGMELFWGTLRWVMGGVIVAAFVLLIFSVLLWATGLPEEYAPMKTAELFNGISDKIIAIRGNCDAEIDETISKFSFSPFYTVDCNGKKVTFTHGHRLNKDNLPEKGTCDILIYGHFHVNEITRNDGVLCVNVASASLPKNGAKPAFCTVADDGLKLETFDDEILGFVKFG